MDIGGRRGPVSDVDRAKEFYGDRLEFVVDHDTRIGDGARVVQLTPPGSGCSIVIGEGVVPPMEPGRLQGLQLVVPTSRQPTLTWSRPASRSATSRS